VFLHRKELIQPVRVGKPDARFGTFCSSSSAVRPGSSPVLEYRVLSFHVGDAGVRDMLQNIVIEELSDLEMVGKLIAQHTSKPDQGGRREGQKIGAELRCRRMTRPAYGVVLRPSPGPLRIASIRQRNRACTVNRLP
jgi:Mn-containing catalase